MSNEQASFETIKSKLLKLQALAEKGYNGEAETAKRLLDKLCKQYGVSLDEVLNREKKKYCLFNVGRAKVYFNLFMQCYANVTGEIELKYIKQSNSEIKVMLTAYQCAEIANLSYWHKTNLKKDIENAQRLVFEAYVQKHRIFRDRSNDPEDQEDEEQERKPIDLARLQAIGAMMDTLNDNRFHKMIEK